MKFLFVLLFYRLALLILTPIILLILIFKSKKNPQYRQRILERLGFVASQLTKQGFIVHAASVGEVIAIQSFIKILLKTFPNIPITITTFTPTGSAQVLKLFKHEVQHCYLPVDNFISTKIFLQRLKPRAMIFMETEIWPDLIHQCATNHIALLLINGRLSDKSCRRYKKINALITPTLQQFNYVLAQSQQHWQNLIRLGVSPQKCSVSGNLKYDISASKEVLKKANLLTSMILGDRLVWLVASTHKGDDEICLAAFKRLKKECPKLLLIIAPRHPERFNEVAFSCKKQAFKVTRRSDNKPINTIVDIWLLDSLGELMAVYSLADIVTVAGTFSHIGGHNPLEAALFKKPIIVGPDMSNFSAILMQLKQAQGIIQLKNKLSTETKPVLISKRLSDVLSILINDKHQRNNLGQNAYQVMLSNQGASQISVNKVAEICGLPRL